MELAQEQCTPCKGGTPPLTHEEAQDMAMETPQWQLEDDKIERQFKFKDFQEAMGFVNKVAELAEGQDHHPDIHISYSKVRLELSTHAIGGLSRNDFVLAAKIDELV